MQFLIGFAIAIMIGLTGVGGGVITAPVLTLFLGIPPAQAIGTALVFSALVKMVAAPAYLIRRQVDFRILALLLSGGVPGVIIGSILLERLRTAGRNGPLLGVLGATVVILALANLYRAARREHAKPARDHSRWLPWIALPIGAEVGFSSAGAGALGSLVILSLTPIAPAAVVGTDVMFGLGLSLAGGGLSLGWGNVVGSLALKLSVGGVAGALIGATLLTRIPSRPLRILLSLWLVMLGAQLCWRAISA
jgi:uncharacterized protein